MTYSVYLRDGTLGIGNVFVSGENLSKNFNFLLLDKKFVCVIFRMEGRVDSIKFRVFFLDKKNFVC